MQYQRSSLQISSEQGKLDNSNSDAFTEEKCYRQACASR
ncbi:hypothetical protein [Citrobacter pasteurii]|nr:hypothetical protein [Citrobacter pasteurii]